MTDDKIYISEMVKNIANILKNSNIDLGEYISTNCSVSQTKNSKFYTCAVKFSNATLSFDMFVVPEKNLVTTRSRISPLVMYTNKEIDTDIIEKSLLNKVFSVSNKKKVIDDIICEKKQNITLCLVDLKNYKNTSPQKTTNFSSFIKKFLNKNTHI